jgi:3',5'-cyclic AMP phosphodiesterase CpdA
MVKIWVISDLHYEILGADVTEHLPRPEADVLVIAGDYYRARLAVPRARLQFPGIPLVMRWEPRALPQPDLREPRHRIDARRQPV